MFITTLGFFKKVNNSADSEAQMPIFMTLTLLCNARYTAAPSSQGTDDCGATVLTAANPSQTHANFHRLSFLFTRKVAGYEAQRTESPDGKSETWGGSSSASSEGLSLLPWE